VALNLVKARRAPSRSWCVNPKSISLIASALTAAQIGEKRFRIGPVQSSAGASSNQPTDISYWPLP